MASVHLAQLKGERNFAKWVAVKVIHRQFAGDPKFERMFLNEARLLARIDHPNVCTVFDFGEVRGTYYLAMEYLHGQTVHRLMKQAQTRAGSLSYGCAARIIADAADGLHAAHELVTEDGTSATVVHRDVSPTNLVVLYSGVTKVLDFGIACSNDREEEFTSVDEIKGKLTYMAPEQLRREELDRRCDVFSLGIVLWEMTCGRRLFRRKHEGETVVALLTEAIPTPSSVVPDYPRQLEGIVMRALARDRAQRYQTAAEMAADLEQFIVDSGKSIGHSNVAEAIRGLFGREIDEHTTSLRRSADLLKQIEELSVPDLEVDMQVGEAIEVLPALTPTPKPTPTPRRRPMLLALAVVALVGIAVAATWWGMRTPAPPATIVATDPPRGATPPPAQPSAPVVSPIVSPVVAAPVAAPAVAAPAVAAPAIAAPAPPRAAAPTYPAAGARQTGKRFVGKHPVLQADALVKPAAPQPSVAPPIVNAPPKSPAVRKDHDEDSNSPRPMTSFE
jgi:eukaryotic-like serine/threonine-protein kinase